MARRNVFDPLEPTHEPRWYVVRDRLNVVLKARALDACTDPKRVFVVAMLERIDAGWRLGEFSSTGGVFFCTRGADLRMVSITPTKPGKHAGFGAVHLSAAPVRDTRTRANVPQGMIH